MLYENGGKFYIKVTNGYREVEIVNSENSFGYRAKGETVSIDGSPNAYTIEEIIAKYHITEETANDFCEETGREENCEEAGREEAREETGKKAGKKARKGK